MNGIRKDYETRHRKSATTRNPHQRVRAKNDGNIQEQPRRAAAQTAQIQIRKIMTDAQRCCRGSVTCGSVAHGFVALWRRGSKACGSVSYGFVALWRRGFMAYGVVALWRRGSMAL